MPKTVVIVGALDTKGNEFAFVKECIEREGLKTLVVDFGVMGSPMFEADVKREEVVARGGGDMAYLASGEHKDEAMQTMAKGLAVVVRKLYDEGNLDGILGMGGTGGTSVATAGMRTLPVGVPKVMVSTVGGGDVGAYAGMKDITFIPSIVDVAGINRVSRTIFLNAAGAITGMVKAETPRAAATEKPLIAASMFGNTTLSVDQSRTILEEKGYEVLVFHTIGTGGATMEGLIADGYFVGLMDITTTELADEVCGGVFSAGPDRCMAAASAGIPQVLVPGCVDMVNFHSISSMPRKYRKRKLYQWNPNVTLMRTNVKENARIGEIIASSANAAEGSIAILLPLNGVSMLDAPDGDFWDPEADRACFDAIKKNVKPGIPVHELNFNINDPQFSEAVANKMLEFLR